MNRLKRLKKVMAGEIPGAPVSELLGYKIVEVEKGRVVVELVANESMHNPMGILHGGILCDIADAAMGYAFASTLAEDEVFSTVEIKLNFLKPVFREKLRAEGTLIKKGSSVGLLECNIYDEKQSLVAHSTSTCMVIKGVSGRKRIQENNGNCLKMT